MKQGQFTELNCKIAIDTLGQTSQLYSPAFSFLDLALCCKKYFIYIAESL